jgi:hypothetical protein
VAATQSTLSGPLLLYAVGGSYHALLLLLLLLLLCQASGATAP